MPPSTVLSQTPSTLTGREAADRFIGNTMVIREREADAYLADFEFVIYFESGGRAAVRVKPYLRLGLDQFPGREQRPPDLALHLWASKRLEAIDVRAGAFHGHPAMIRAGAVERLPPSNDSTLG